MSLPSTNPKALSAKPTRNIFDAWNTSSSGHQRAENRLSGSVSWRQSRSLKLGEQFSSGAGGGKRVADTVGAGSEDFGKDGRRENGSYERGAKGLRKGGQMSLQEAFGVMKQGVLRSEGTKEHDQGVVSEVFTQEEEAEGEYGWPARGKRNDTSNEVLEQKATPAEKETKRPQVFKGLTIYINGSTAPLVSDHNLKRLLVAHGANLSIALGRRTVTHVVLGRPNGATASSSASRGSGSGGGLAATKIQKEIASKVGNGVKFVTAEWVLESVKQGKRVPEARFEALRLAPKGTASLPGMFARAKS